VPDEFLGAWALQCGLHHPQRLAVLQAHEVRF